MKKIIFMLLMLVAFLVVGCSNNQEESNMSSKTEVPSIQTQLPTSQPTEQVDYGKVKFSNVVIYDKGYDGIRIDKSFTKPELCKNEIFEYEIAKEEICYIEDERIYFLSEGTTKVTATSEHLKSTFYVFSYNNFDFYSQANSQIARLNNFVEGQTLFLGDSFFEFWRNGTGNGVVKFDTVFADYAVFNIGISATTTHDWRAMNSKIEMSAINPKNIVINIGINNVDDDSETGDEASKNIINLIEDYLVMYPNTNIYYLSITECSGHFSYKWPYHQKSNELMKAYCESTERVNYLDVMELYGSDCAKYQDDGLHPNKAGYELFEKIIKENVPLELIK